MFTLPSHAVSATTGDDIAELLSDPHCRYLLEFLSQREGPASVSAATRYIVEELTDTSGPAVPENVQRRVQTWLHHGQLPALADRGLVDFDPDEGTVELTAESTALSTSESSQRRSERSR